MPVACFLARGRVHKWLISFQRRTPFVPLVIRKKFRYIAESKGRSANKEIEQYLKRCVASYEKENGTIPVEENQQD